MTRALFALLAAVLLAGCAGAPPAPPACEGELVPINAPAADTNAGGAR